MASNPSSSSSSSSSDKLNNGNSSKYCSATLDDAFFKTSLKNNGKMSNFQVLASCANLLTVTDDLHSCAVSDGEDSTKVKRTRKKKRKIYRRSLSVSDISYYINSNSTKKHNIPSEKESNEIDLHSDKSNNKSLINYNSYSKQQKITLIFLAVINFGAYLSMSVIAPFFPIEVSFHILTMRRI